MAIITKFFLIMHLLHTSTSFNNDHHKFTLILWLWLQSGRYKTKRNLSLSERKKMWISLFENQEPTRIKVYGNAVIHIYYLNHDYDAIPMISPPNYPPPVVLPPSFYRYPIYNDRLGLAAIVPSNHSSPDFGFYSNRSFTSSFSNAPLRYPYDSLLYKPELSLPLVRISWPLDYTLFNRTNIFPYFYSAPYSWQLRYYPVNTLTTNYYTNFHLYNFPYL